MISLTADNNMLAILGQANELAEIRDPSGNVIGFYAPVAVERALHYVNVATRIDRAELERRKAEPGPGHTTREVFEYLKTLTPDEEGRAILDEKIALLAKEGRITYTIVWNKSAQNELARIWTQHSNRQTVADAADEIDRRLRVSPEQAGKDRGGGDRYLEIAPLVIIYSVHPDHRRVRVRVVWLLP